MNNRSSNQDSLEALSQEIRLKQRQCAEECNFAQNNEIVEIRNFTSENIGQKALDYVEGVRVCVESCETPISTDVNLMTNLFVHDMREKTSQLEELIAYQRGLLKDKNYEIEQLQLQTKIVQEALQKPLGSNNLNITGESIKKCRAKFREIKDVLHNLMRSMFPDKYEDFKNLLAQLMHHNLQDPNTYLPITDSNKHIVELLLHMKIVTQHPYNDQEIKLAYN